MVKSTGQFPPKRRGHPELQSWCRSCFAEVNATNYAKDREPQRARRVRRTNARRAEAREQLVRYLRQHPCIDCGESDVVVLEFDHRGRKVADVSTYANGGRSWTRILAEIQKCDVRCANCHRRVTATRRKRKVSPSTPRRLPIQLAIDVSGAVRTCRACGMSKPLAEFALRSAARSTFHWICLACQRIATAAWYARSVGRPVRAQRPRGSARRTDLALRVFTYLASHPCVDCGEGDPVVLDFDHRRDKMDDISSLVLRRATWEVIAAEIEKCDVRCANCHRRRTSGSNGAYRTRMQDIGEAELRPGRDSNPRPSHS